MFSLKELQSATNNFNYDNKIGEGGFGSVYWGQLWDGSQLLWIIPLFLFFEFFLPFFLNIFQISVSVILKSSPVGLGEVYQPKSIYIS